MSDWYHEGTEDAHPISDGDCENCRLCSPHKYDPLEHLIPCGNCTRLNYLMGSKMTPLPAVCTVEVRIDGRTLLRIDACVACVCLTAEQLVNEPNGGKIVLGIVSLSP